MTDCVESAVGLREVVTFAEAPANAAAVSRPRGGWARDSIQERESGWNSESRKPSAETEIKGVADRQIERHLQKALATGLRMRLAKQ